MRFGVLGTGYWADTCHAAGLAAHPGVELVGVWGRDAAKASRLAERYGVVADVDLDSLLGKVDAVAIAVAPAAQAQLACRAAAAGCHLLLEKPLALSTVDADRIVAAVERANVSTISYFTFHFLEPGASWLRDSVLPLEWHGGTFTLLASILGPNSPFKGSAWRHEEGVVLWDAAPHTLSLMLAALGPIKDVTAMRGLGETLHLALEHESGAVSSTTMSLTAPEPSEHIGCEFWGPAGIAVYPDALLGSEEEAYATAVSELIESADTGIRPACDVAFAAEIVRVLARAESFLARQGR